MKKMLMDFDGTLTIDGMITSVVLKELEFLKSNFKDLELILITGRSYGWANCLIQTLPFDSIIFEQGAGMIKRFNPFEVIYYPHFEKNEKENIINTVKMIDPNLKLSADQDLRLTDVAVEIVDKSLDEIKKVLETLSKHFSTDYKCVLSNIHINIYKGSYNKLLAVRHFFDLNSVDEKECFFVGDSLNDESMFQYFTNSFGVGQIRKILHLFEHPPKHILDKNEGAGLADLLHKINNGRIGVCIPVFNRPNALENVLKGFLNYIPDYMQNWFYFILVDNGSTEFLEISAVYHKYRKMIPNLFLLFNNKHETTFRLCRARNIAMNFLISNYKDLHFRYFVFHDSDIVSTPLYWKTLFNRMISYDWDVENILVGERIFVNEWNPNDNVDPSKLERVKSSSNYNLSIDRRIPYLLGEKKGFEEHPWAFVHGGNMILERSLNSHIEWNETYDGHWGYEDTQFTYDFINSKKNRKVIFIKDLYVYHQEEINTCSNYLNEKFDKTNNPNFNKICKLILGFKEFKLRQYSEMK